MLKFVASLGASLLLQAAPSFAADMATAQDASTKIDVRLSSKGNDIAFDQAAIQIPFGKPLKLKFLNQAAKGSEILHNVAILKPGSTEEVLKQLQLDGYDIDKARAMKSILVMTKAIEPGAEETLEFTPPEPGFYPYICLMAGHADMLGMKGVLNVVKK